MDNDDDHGDELLKKSITHVRVIHDFRGSNNDELCMKRNDVSLKFEMGIFFFVCNNILIYSCLVLCSFLFSLLDNHSYSDTFRRLVGRHFGWEYGLVSWKLYNTNR